MKINFKNILTRKKERPEEQERFALSSLSGPKLKFKRNAEILLGQYLDILPYLSYYAIREDKILYKFDITKKQHQEIASTFKELLALMGYNELDTCVISDVKSSHDQNDFELHFNGSDKAVYLHYAYDGDGTPEFRFHDGKTDKTYFFHSRKYSHDCDTFQLYTYTTINGDMQYRRTYSKNEINIVLKDNEQKLSLEIKQPTKTGDKYKGPFILPNEDELKEYISGLTFPMDITEVYKEICNLLHHNTKQYAKFSLQISTYAGYEVETGTTDLISLTYGALNKFIITKDDKTVSIDKDGNWKYKTSEFVTSATNGNITYDAQSKINSQMQIEEARGKVDTTKELIKTIFGAV